MAITISRGKLNRPTKLCLYGPEGVGKTTIASATPGAVFIDAEGGTDQLDVARIRVHSLAEINAAVAHLRGSKECGTVVLDTVDWIEQRITEAMLAEDNKKSVEDYGFGKGQVMVSERFMEFLTSLNSLLRVGKNVVLLAHSTIKRFAQPELAGEYDRYELKMSKKCAPLVKEWADALLFLNFESKTTTPEEKGDRVRGVQGTARALYTTRCAVHDAKNRYNLPEKLKAEYASIAVLFAGTGNAEKIAPAAETIAPSIAPAAEAIAPTEAPAADAPKAAESLQAQAAKVATDAGKSAEVLAFLVSKSEIKPGGSFAGLSDAYAERIIKNATAFLKAVDDAA